MHLFLSGSTPYGCYQKLIEYYKSGDLSFKYVKTFNMDEYVGEKNFFLSQVSLYVSTELIPDVSIVFYYFLANS